MEFPDSLYPTQAERELLKLNSLRQSKGIWYRAKQLGGRIRDDWLEQSIRQNLDSLRFVLVLGHMRSGSSLLAQLLGSHPEIAAFGETHTVVTGAKSLMTLAKIVFKNSRASPYRKRICVDKLLHSELLEDVRNLHRLPVEWIVLLRDIDSTSLSLEKTFAVPRKRAESYWDMRTQMLLSQARELSVLNQRVAVLTYESLTSDLNSTLNELSIFLRLNSPLKDQYRFNHQGQKPGAGDPSSNLSAGKVIIKDRKLLSERYSNLLTEFMEIPSAVVIAPYAGQ